MKREGRTLEFQRGLSPENAVTLAILARAHQSWRRNYSINGVLIDAIRRIGQGASREFLSFGLQFGDEIQRQGILFGRLESGHGAELAAAALSSVLPNHSRPIRVADENRSLRALLQPVSRRNQKEASRLCHESRDALLSLEPPVFSPDRD